MITVYGIRQCDTCRKALKWLEARGTKFRFHDLRTDGLNAEKIAAWLDSPFADRLVNRRSTTWRGLNDRERAMSGDALAALLLEHPTLIKRPVFEREGILAIGFDTAQLERELIDK